MGQNLLNIAIYQFSISWESPSENRLRIGMAVGDYMDKIVEGNRPDILLLPEFFTVGFSMNPALAEPEGGDTLGWMLSLSRKCGAAVAGSFPVRTPDGIFNRFYFVTPDGRVEYYDKRHLFRMSGENEVFASGQRRKIVEYKGWNIALNVCYDLRFPIWSRNFGNAYDVMLNVASWPASRAEAADILVKARAIENIAYYVFANRCGISPDTEYGGGSEIVDYKGRVVSKICLKEGISDGKVLEEGCGFVSATLDLGALKAFRKKFPAWKDADFDNREKSQACLDFSDIIKKRIYNRI